MWHNQKILNMNDTLLNRKMHVQEALIDIEKTIQQSTGERQEKLASESFAGDKSFDRNSKALQKRHTDKVFESWLQEQGFKHAKTVSKKETVKLALPEIPKTDRKDDDELKLKREKSRITSGMTDSSFNKLHGIMKTNNMPTEKLAEDLTRVKTPRWNISTRLKKEPYLKNLDDFYPRDPYTLMPSDTELLLLHRELNGLTIEEVKEFMRENYKDKAMKNRDKIDVIESTTKKMHTLEPNTEREHYFRPKNIMDYEPKRKDPEHKYGLDQASFALSRTPTSTCYDRTRDFLNDKQKQVSEPDVQNDEVLVNGNNFFDVYFGPELYEYMKDKKNGKISKKYEKVFIC
jgi:hypothetical protein